jgi:hypothetical protein
MKPGELQQVIGIVLGALTVLITGTIEWQLPATATFATLLAASAIGGAVAGRILVPGGERIPTHLVVMVSGALAAAGSFVAVRWWVRGRASAMAAELMLVALLGAIPGVVAGKAGYARLRRRPDPVPPAKARPAR